MLMEVRDIARALAAQAPALVRDLLPAGRREGDEWRVGSPAGEPGRSMAVRLSGPRAGVWCDFASGQAGDALDLVAACLFGGDKRQAVAWARRWLGLEGPQRDAARRRAEAAAARQPEPPAEAAAAGRSAAAKRLWLAGKPDILGTPVHAYLKARAIDLTHLPRQPRALRFDPAHLHGPSGRRFPAMLAAVVDAAGRHLATHRTFLAQDPRSGRWTKAPVEDPKLAFGPIKGGFVPLWRGGSGRPIAEAADGETVAIAEGIEDGLAVALICPEWRVLAALAAGNLPEIALPPAIAEVVLIGQRDGENPGVRRAREAALARWQGEGRRVRAAYPPAPYKDFNDWLAAELAAEMRRA